MKNNTKAVFFDIDGTIFTPDVGVPLSTKKAIAELLDNNVLPIICTGRANTLISDDIKALGFSGIIAGAGTYVEYDGNEIFRQDLDDTLTMNLIKDMRCNNLIPLPEGHITSYYDTTFNDGSFKEVLNRYFKDCGSAMLPIPDDFSHLGVAKVSGRITKDSNCEFLIEKYSNNFNIVNHSNILLEFIPSYSSKAIGIKKFLEHTGINSENTYAFGDSMNDLEMLQYVNVGIAMGNSDKRILTNADYVTDDIYHDGIYNALKKFNLI